MDQPEVGSRVTHNGVEYIVNRVTAQERHNKPMRLQIDAMAVTECERRRDNLAALIRGEAAVDPE